MLEEIPIENSNLLSFFDRNQIVSDLSILDKHPDIVMLSSWNRDVSNYDEVKPLVEKLLDSGCKYFVCAGEHSESLHDFIDDLILERSIDSDLVEGIDVMTTWHDTDTEEEVAEFFLYATNAHDSLLMAFLEEGRPEDDKLKHVLLNLV
jgi:hypothetical protein